MELVLLVDSAGWKARRGCSRLTVNGDPAAEDGGLGLCASFAVVSKAAVAVVVDLGALEVTEDREAVKIFWEGKGRDLS
jgi:hypothetical protein